MARGNYRYDSFGWAPYVPVGTKILIATKYAANVAKKEKRDPSPVKIEGRKIAKTFWGQAWCNNLESYSDFANRLPRGATYVRNGSVVDLVIKPLAVQAIVAGSETYRVNITIKRLAPSDWKQIKNDCSSAIESLIDLLAGKLSNGVMGRLTRQNDGLFPSPREITMKCSCPDGSYVCKHIAAVMYGVGSRLDSQPELLFLLRDVDHQELAGAAVAQENLQREFAGENANRLENEDLGAMFGIELESAPDTRVDGNESPKPHKASKARATTKMNTPVKNRKTEPATSGARPRAKKKAK